MFKYFTNTGLHFVLRQYVLGDTVVGNNDKRKDNKSILYKQ